MAKGYPDYYRGSLLFGLKDGVPTGINMDDAGNLIALLKAVYGTTPTTIQCDADGFLKMNISGMNLDTVLARPYKGATQYITTSGVTTTGADKTIFSITGPAAITSMYVKITHTSAITSCFLLTNIDNADLGTILNVKTVGELYSQTGKSYYLSPVTVDNTNVIYAISLSQDVYFSTLFTLKLRDFVEAGVSYEARITYYNL